MNKKGFLLVDSLICIIIVSLLSCLCMYTYTQINNFNDGYKLYYENNTDKYKDLYKGLGECVKCQIEEEGEIEEDL